MCVFCAEFETGCHQYHMSNEMERKPLRERSTKDRVGEKGKAKHKRAKPDLEFRDEETLTMEEDGTFIGTDIDVTVVYNFMRS